MNAEQLLAHYERISEAPDAIARLRQFVLDLAVRGKLVEQIASDEPASILLKRMAAEKAHLTKSKKIKKSEVDPITADEVVYELPFSWQWARLGEIGDWGAGSTPSRSNADLYGGGITWLKSGELNDNSQLAGSDETVTELAVEKGSFRVNQPGDVLIAMYGATIGKLAILAEVAVTNQAVCGCTPFDGISNRFLFLFLLSQREAFRSASEGGAQPNISKVKIIWSPIAVPPLAEQYRIVAKVDELMALCDRLEEARKEREAARDRLTAASLAPLNAPDPDPATFTTHARFALDNLPALTTRANQIKQLRQTILNLAVWGKLADQNASDEPAVELLAKIASEKAQLAKLGAIKKPKTLPSIPETEVPADIPDGWHPTRLGTVIDLLSGQHLQPNEYSETPDSGVPYITGPSDFRESGLSITRFALIRKAVAREGQLLLTVKGSGVGKSTICDLPEVAISRQLMALTPLGWDIAFLNLIIHRLAERLQDQARSLIPGIGRDDVESFVFVLPPLAEQHRIVAKVDELMALCDRLEASLVTGDETRQRLLEAILHEALEPAESRELEPV